MSAVWNRVHSRACSSAPLATAYRAAVECSAVRKIHALCERHPKVLNAMYYYYYYFFGAKILNAILLFKIVYFFLNWHNLSLFQYCRKIEEKRGVSVTDSGAPEVKITSPAVNGLQLESFQRTSGTVSSSRKSSSSWDEDWGPTAKGPTTTIHPLDSNLSSKQTMPIAQIIPVSATSVLASITSQQSASSQQTASSCPAVDIEWPPSTLSSGSGPQLANSDKLMDNSKGPADTTFDGLDPFADWPPRSSNSISSWGSSMNSMLSSHNNVSSGLNKAAQSSAGVVNNSNPMGLSTQNHGKSGPNMRSSQSNIGFANNNNIPIGLSKQYQGSNNLNGIGFSTNNVSGLPKQGQGTTATDLASIFVSSKREHPTPKLAPPPTTAGRGRGRHQGYTSHSAASRSSQAKAPSEQPPLLDLL